MASLNLMVKRLAGLQGTRDVSEWEDQFISSVLEATRNGDDTRALTERQITVVERLFRKHFAG